MRLRVRCQSDEYGTLNWVAISRYFRSLGNEFPFVELLPGHPEPNELEVANLSKSLAKNLGIPNRVEFTAWNLPMPIKE